MKLRVAAVVSALVLGMSAPVSSVIARGLDAGPSASPDVTITGSLGVHDGPDHAVCPGSSASEGNANQQNFPVKQYGQTSGGPRC